MRISKNEYYMGIAKAVSQRSTCIRRKYGAVIVKDNRIIGTGYNGSPSGEENCCDVGYCYREENNIPSGEQYERCKSKHAESNAIMFADRRDLVDATLYLYGEDSEGLEIEAEPCSLCWLDIKQSKISKVVSNGGKSIIYYEDI